MDDVLIAVVETYLPLHNADRFRKKRLSLKIHKCSFNIAFLLLMANLIEALVEALVNHLNSIYHSLHHLAFGDEKVMR